jgi:hypothetical protein
MGSPPLHVGVAAEFGKYSTLRNICPLDFISHDRPQQVFHNLLSL